MMRRLMVLGVAMLLGACVPEGSPDQGAPGFTVTRSAKEGTDAYYRVAGRVRPVAVQICKSLHAARPASFCDFQVKVINDPSQAPNAYQSIGRDGRPVISFNINMLRSLENDDEIAFIFGHEAGHQIARHLEQTQQNQIAGALIGGILIAAGGGDASVGVDLGAQIGGRSYSKTFELQADTLAAHIADRAGYDAARGARTFDRTTGSSALLATHPPSAQRKDNVTATIARINRAKAQGGRAPITW